MRIILASKSPRRLELLSMTGLPFEVITSHVDEDAVERSVISAFDDGYVPSHMYEVAEDISIAQAEAKAHAVLQAVDKDAALSDDVIVIGSDTVVVTDDEILGKPKDEADARRMLTKLSGKTHRVYTGVTILKSSAGTGKSGGSNVQSRRFSAFADVKFHDLDSVQKDQIERYIAGGSPMDKAGAYGIQDEGALLIDSISGDYYAVVGLPVSRVNRELQSLL